jgi:two-component system cell cycle sensor histidine kinase/response regulator CckA
MLAITDTGFGMDEKTQSRLFEPFFTTKEQGKGTGLGLATVYGIVKQSGGNIWVYSEPGKGTTFKIYLPRVEAEPEDPAKQAAKTARGRGELVMVVEDEPSLRTLFARMIKSLGYRVIVAANGSEALAVVEKEGLMPDLLITDVVMPGMSGRELAEHLNRRQPGLKVLFTSGYTDNAIVHHGVLDSQTPFLQKPFSTGDLAARISELLISE